MFGRRRARVVAVLGVDDDDIIAQRLAAALAAQAKRVMLLTDRPGFASLTFADLACDAYAFDPHQFGNLVQISSAAADYQSRLIDFQARAQTLLFDRLAALQQVSDIVVIDAEGSLCDALAQTREVVVAVSPLDEDVLRSYADIKSFTAMHGNTDMGVYTLIEHASSDERADRLARNLAATARTFLSLDIHHLGCIDRRNPATIEKIAMRLAQATQTALSPVAIETCVAYLFQSGTSASAASPAL